MGHIGKAIEDIYECKYDDVLNNLDNVRKIVEELRDDTTECDDTTE